MSKCQRSGSSLFNFAGKSVAVFGTAGTNMVYIPKARYIYRKLRITLYLKTFLLILWAVKSY